MGSKLACAALLLAACGGSARRGPVAVVAHAPQAAFAPREGELSAGADAIAVTQRVDDQAVAIEPLAIPEGPRHALGSEITRALTLAPIGTAGLALPPSISAGDRLETFATLGVPVDAPIAPRVAVRCVVGGGDGGAPIELSCSGSLDRDIQLAPELAARGMRAFVRGSLSIRAVLDPQTGMAPRCEHHIRHDVVEQLGRYEEHESADVTVRTRLEPRSGE